MEKNIRQICKDILNNNCLEENIPRFLNLLINKYQTYSAVKLALHYFTIFEVFYEDKDKSSASIKDVINEVNNVIKSCFVDRSGADKFEEYTRRIDMHRNNIIRRMDSIFGYIDRIKIYEYVLNRIEYRFLADEAPEEDDEFARDVLNYIFRTQDNAIINENIRDIIGQLPVRITRQRYYDIIRDAINKYIATDADSLNTFLYLLRTSTMLGDEGKLAEDYPQLDNQVAILAGLDYKQITKQQFEEVMKELGESADFIIRESENYYTVQEIINDLYTLLISTPYAVSDVRLERINNAAFSIISEINGLINNHKDILELSENNDEKDTIWEPSDELMANLETLEGVQEELSLDIIALDEALEHINNHHRKLSEGIMADKLLNVLHLCSDLCSESIFIDFYEIKDTSKVDENRAMIEADRLITELSELFNKLDRRVIRAVMANSFSIISGFFDSPTEVMEYVRYSLEKCTDSAEKIACNRLIRGMMNE